LTSDSNLFENFSEEAMYNPWSTLRKNVEIAKKTFKKMKIVAWTGI
jgi:hypothetical protein